MSLYSNIKAYNTPVRYHDKHLYYRVDMDQPQKTIVGAAATSGASGVMTKSNNTALLCTELMVTISTTIHVVQFQHFEAKFKA